MEIISVRERPDLLETVIRYFQKQWASEESMYVYDDCIRSSLQTSSPLPQWYLLIEKQTIVGCVGLITNDFISRMDLYPWICALYIEEAYRGHGYGNLMLRRALQDACRFGYQKAYLCTDHIGYYEHYGFDYLGTGYHPWGNSSRIYVASTSL